MEIFVIHKGEQSGPHRIFELRDMIAAGKFEITDSGWYKGLDSWKPLSEIDALRDAIPEDETVVEEPQAAPETPAADIDEPSERGVLPPVIPEAGDTPQQASVLFTPEALGRRMWVRFGARVTDSVIFGLIVTGIAAAFGFSADELPSERAIVAFQVLTTLAWFIIDAALITSFGTTPGKAIAGLWVTDEEGNLPTNGRSLIRSLLVFVFGWGFGMPLLTLLSLVVSQVRMKQVGNTLWDERAKTVVRGKPISQGRMSLLLIIPLVAVAISTYFMWPQIQASVDAYEAEAAEKSAPADPQIQ